MSIKTLKSMISDSQIKRFIIPDGQFLGLLNNNFKKTQAITKYTNIGKKEYDWGVSKINKYNIPMNGSLKYWSGPFGEQYIWSLLTDKGYEVRRPEKIKRYTPDWECDQFIYEVKTRNYSSTGSIGEKALGIPLKYCEIPELYKKPLKIVLVGKMEMEAINKYGIIIDENFSQGVSKTKQKLINVYKDFGIEFVGASKL